MKLATTALALTLTTSALIAGTTTPADAAILSGKIRHTADTGYQAAFIVECSTGKGFTIAEGHTSTEYCGDVAKVYIRANEVIRCRVTTETFRHKWVTAWAGQGWHTVSNTFTTRDCVAGRP